MQERLLGAALGATFTALVVLENRKAVHRSIVYDNPVHYEVGLTSFLDCISVYSRNLKAIHYPGVHVLIQFLYISDHKRTGFAIDLGSEYRDLNPC